MTIKEELERARYCDFITVKQVALITQYSTLTIYRKAAKGEIPGLRRWSSRGAIRFHRATVMAWVNRNLAQRDLRPTA